MSRYVRKPQANGVAQPAEDSGVVGWVQQQFPAVWEYLTLSSWEDGQERLTATLLLFVEDGVVKVCLNDRACERSAWAAGRLAEDALASLEAGLQEDSASWRRSSKRRGR